MREDEYDASMWKLWGEAILCERVEREDCLRKM